MKRKFLAAMALAVSVSAASLTAYASETVSGSAVTEIPDPAQIVTSDSGVSENAADVQEADNTESPQEQTADPDGAEEETSAAPSPDAGETEDPEEESYTAGWNQVTGADGQEYTVYYDEEAGAVKTGLFEADGAQYYAGADGFIIKSEFADVDGKTLYFDQDGRRVTQQGWMTVRGQVYYILDGSVSKGNYTARPESGWLIVGSDWYLLDPADGHRLSGLQREGNDLYYLDPAQDDKMFTSINDTDGWKQVNGTWYFFRSWGGALNNGWNKLGIDYYWFHEDGSMASDEWLKDGGNLYYLRDWGGMIYDQWRQDPETTEWYYFRNWGGALNCGWSKIGNDWYWFDSDCTMRRDEWLEEGGNLYYLRDWGGMLYDAWQKRDGEWYYFRSWGGALNCGWSKIGNDWYWFDTDCTMASDQWLQQGSDWYYLRDWGGRLHDQWYKVDNDWYYFGSDGKMLHDQWLHDGNDWYYLRGWGGMMYSQWYTENGKTYYFRSWGGRCHSGEFVIDGETYYFDSEGVLTDRKELQQVIVIDPGHQAKGDSTKEPLGPGSSVMKARVTSGTSGCVSGLDEYELNLQVSLLLRTELESRGYTVYMTRETHDVNISNKERAEYATAVGGDILVRIHANSSENSSVNGALCMAPSDSNAFVSALAPESQRLSQCIIDSYCQATGLRNRGVSITDDMSGINWSTIPVTIVEMGFMSNPGDDAKMADSSFQQTMVQGIADGIDAYFQ